MIILVINAGSSSMKYQLINMVDNKVMAKGNCDRIGIDGVFTHKTDKHELKENIKMDNHAQAITVILKTLVDETYGVIKSQSEIHAIGQRIVHGGEYFTKAAIIDDDCVEKIKIVSPLAPLHNPAVLESIKACRQIMPNTPQVGVFDTAFHQTMPSEAFMYGLPYEFYEKNKIRKYGFHGTSHMYVSKKSAKMLGKKPEDLKTVICHLGNGSSITAVKNGQCIDTSMGFTPLDGLIMGTRCGSIDPAIVTYMINTLNIDKNEIDTIMNKKSGVAGISGVSSDFRDLDVAAENGNERAKLALRMFVYQVVKFIGAYAAAMNGIDVLAFTAGIGENNSVMRSEICSMLSFLGIKIDEEKNKQRGQAIDISAQDAKVKTLVVPTNEELMIAIQTMELVK